MNTAETALRYSRPNTLQQALALLHASPHTVLAGGTDFYPSLGASYPTGPVLDITAIKELKGIAQQEDGYRIGALCSWTDIVRADLPPAFKALQSAALEVGSVQIQNRATIVGNICNASPAADGVPALLCLNAMVELVSVKGGRRMALAEFIQGNRRTLKADNELVAAIFIPASSCTGYSDFIKLGARKYLVISIAMVAVRLVIENDKISDAAVAVGSCSEVAIRLQEIEAALTGSAASVDAIGKSLPNQVNGIRPINDVRGSAAYRKDVALKLIKRSLQRCLQSVVQS